MTLREFRKSKGIKLTDLARASGIFAPVLMLIEAGARTASEKEKQDLIDGYQKLNIDAKDIVK